MVAVVVFEGLEALEKIGVAEQRQTADLLDRLGRIVVVEQRVLSQRLSATAKLSLTRLPGNGAQKKEDLQVVSFELVGHQVGLAEGALADEGLFLVASVKDSGNWFHYCFISLLEPLSLFSSSSK